MLLFYTEIVFDPAQPRTNLNPDGSGLALALHQTGLSYLTWDFSEPTFHLLRRKRQLAEAMQAEFTDEGSLFLYEHLLSESDGGQDPYNADITSLSRYLYQVM